MYDPINYFELVGIPESFEIDKDILHKNYLKLQQVVHPDKIISGSKTEKILAIEFAAQANRAYNILNDDKKRAEYLLYLKGFIVNQEDGNNVKPDPLMLAEILELSDDPKSYDILAMKQECWAVFKLNYAHEKYSEAAKSIIKLQYLSKL